VAISACVGITAFSNIRGNEWLILFLRQVITRYLAGRVNKFGNDQVRATVRDHAVFPDRDHESRTNVHGSEANHRNLADWYIVSLANALGRGVWSISQSQKDQTLGVPGSREFYISKDVGLTPAEDPLPDGGIIKSIDVDYYMTQTQIARFLQLGLTFSMYTIVPDDVSWSTDEVSATWVGDKLQMAIAGGAVYEHPLWDWRRDSATVISWQWWLPTYTRFWVESKEVAPHRCVVTLVPEWSVSGFSVLLAWLLGHDPIQRLTPKGKRSRWLRIQGKPTGTSNGVYYSVGSPGACQSERIPEEAWIYLVKHREVNGKTMTPAAVKRVLSYFNVDEQVKQHPLIVLAIDEALDTQPLPRLNAAPGRYYEPVYRSEPVTDSKPAGRFYIAPIMDGAFVPKRGRTSDWATIDGRILRPRAALAPCDTDPRVEAELLEYAKELIPLIFRPGSVVPLDIEEVIDLQDRPSQVASAMADEMLPGDAKDPLESFQKVEAYPKVTFPRNITNVGVNHRKRWSAFTLALVAVLKESDAPWYAFGMPPGQLAERMHAFALDAEFLVEGDFEKFDGSLRRIVRTFERLVIMHAAHPKFVEDLLDLHDALLRRRATTGYGVSYSVDYTRCSGEAGTSIFNTLINLYVHYCAYRRMGLSPRTALSRVGLVGGDDGVVRDIDPEILEATALDFGMKLKAAVRRAGPVGFLGRLFIDPWETEESYFDVARCLSKLHFTHNADPTIPVSTHLWRRAVSLWITDSRTPLLGTLARRILRLIPEGEIDDSSHIQPWLMEINRHLRECHGRRVRSDVIVENWPEPIFPGPNRYVIQAIEQIATQLDIVTRDLTNINDTWATASTLEAIFRPEAPWFVAPDVPATVTAELDGEIVGPATIPQAPVIPAGPQPPREKLKPCRDYAAGQCRRAHCKFAHIDCKAFAVGRCNRERCRYRHAPAASL
jgi:hypothetical protein